MQRNAIVVMFDTLQYNYLGCYGNSWIKTPNMDRFAREGVLFENCYTEGLPTVPCRRAMHTGRYTLPVKGWVPLSMEDTTIADLCWGRPIDTALIFDCPMYRQPKFGYTRGFDKVYFVHGHEMDHDFYAEDKLYHYDPKNFMSEKAVEGAREHIGQVVLDAHFNEIGAYLNQMQYWKTEEDRYVAKTMTKAVEYLEQIDRNKQFYLWIDSFDPHEPWSPPSVYMDFPCPYDPDYEGKDDFLPVSGNCKELYTERELHHIRMLYAELVTVCDNWFGYLLDAVRRLGLEENTLIMLVSDHGSPMGNDEHGHGIMRKVRPWPYEELVHTPLLMRGPDLPAGKRVAGFASSVDVAPTVCDWLGIDHPRMQGHSLLPMARGEVDKVRDFAIAGYYSASWAIYTEEWSYIHWPVKDKNTFYDSGVNIRKAVESLGRTTEMGIRSKFTDSQADMASDALARHRAAATTDGEAQWSCTPGGAYITPESDELYDREADPLQLNNVIKDYPEIAEQLLNQLKSYMVELLDE